MKWSGLIVVSLVVFSNASRAGEPPVSPGKRVLSSYQLESKKQFREAIEAIMPAYLEAKGDYFLNLMLGWLFYLQGTYPNSLEHYRAALRLESEAIAPRQGLIAVYAAQGKWSEVASEAGNILHSYPGHLQTQQAMVRALIEQKNWPQGLEKVNAYLKSDPIDLTLMEQKANVLVEMKKEILLEDHLKRLLLAYPLDAYARNLKSFSRP